MCFLWHQGVEMAKHFESLVRSDTNFQIPAQRHLGLVVFCLRVREKHHFNVLYPSHSLLGKVFAWRLTAVLADELVFVSSVSFYVTWHLWHKRCGVLHRQGTARRRSCWENWRNPGRYFWFPPPSETNSSSASRSRLSSPALGTSGETGSSYSRRPERCCRPAGSRESPAWCPTATAARRTLRRSRRRSWWASIPSWAECVWSPWSTSVWCGRDRDEPSARWAAALSSHPPDPIAPTRPTRPRPRAPCRRSQSGRAAPSSGRRSACWSSTAFRVCRRCGRSVACSSSITPSKEAWSPAGRAASTVFL